MSGTVIYDGYPRGVSDLNEFLAYRAEMEREVAAHPDRTEARDELDFVNQEIRLMQSLAAEQQ